MIEILKTHDGTLRRLDAVESGCWVNVCAPSDEETRWLADSLGIGDDFIDAMLDRDEISRIDKDARGQAGPCRCRLSPQPRPWVTR